LRCGTGRYKLQGNGWRSEGRRYKFKDNVKFNCNLNRARLKSPATNSKTTVTTTARVEAICRGVG
jgi:hypothetical protein